jgi:hypothetical protein
MSFPEVPLLLYPSFARRFGVEEALLYGWCKQLLDMHCDVETLPDKETEVNYSGVTQQNLRRKIQISVSKWQSITSIWEVHRLQEICQSLQSQQLLHIVEAGTQVQIIQLGNHLQAEQNSPDQLITSLELAPVSNVPAENLQSVVAKNEKAAGNLSFVQGRQINDQEPTRVLPVYDVPPAPAAMVLPKRNVQAQAAPNRGTGEVIKGIGPAPSFGGSTGWKKRTGDALQTIFDQQEILNKQLHAITVEWRPSALFYSTLSRNNIPREFADSCLDEFILFYCDKNRKERSWDHKFLAWIKRAWIKQQSNGSSNTASQQQTGSRNENSQRDTREKRKRITAAIMDIHDTNW